MRTIRLMLFALLSLISVGSVKAQMVTGPDMQDFAAAFGLPDDDQVAGVEATLLSMGAPGNILWPGEQPQLVLQLINTAKTPIVGDATVEIVHYGTRGILGDIWKPKVFSYGIVDRQKVKLDLKAGGAVDVTVRPHVPEVMGGFGIVLDVPQRGRVFVSSFVRTFKPDKPVGLFSKLTIEQSDIDLHVRLGVSPNRTGFGYRPTTDPAFEGWYQEAIRKSKLGELHKRGLTLTVEFGHDVPWTGPLQPMGVPRPWLDAKGVALPGSDKPDIAWLPQYDADFKKMVKRLAIEQGYPNGPVIAMKLWNEPWEGVSICHWGADSIRYREMFNALCEAVEEARAEAGVKILIGGCDSSSNTLDKLFSDGNDRWLSRLDFMSVHYQGLNPFSTYKPFLNRAGGRLQIWDTESWVANVDDRVATVVATNFSTGHDRAVGIFGGNISHSEDRDVRQPDGSVKRQPVLSTWSIAASIGAAQHFIGQRDFQQMVFMNGLPWVMHFNGLPDAKGVANPDDGTLVVIGDIGEAFGRDSALFRTVGLLPDRLATMTIDVGDQPFGLFDFYGNPIAVQQGKLAVPLDHRGFYLRADGSPGSFAKLLGAVRSARIEGLEPVEIVAHDFTRPVDQDPVLRLKLTNVLNRSLTGRLSVRVDKLSLVESQSVTLAGNESRWIEVPVVGGKAEPSNAYPAIVTFDAGNDGGKTLREDLHVNWIARRTPNIDGKLDDWSDMLVQTIVGTGASTPTMQEVAWQPFKNFDTTAEGGLAHAYIAIDDHYFYFAAKVADASVDAGMQRTDSPAYDDAAFYPSEFTIPAQPLKQETLTKMTWPEGVRRYSYRHDPDLPAGNFPNHDNVQIAFNVLSDAEKQLLPNPPGTPRHFTAYQCTDYEFALNPVAEEVGGGTEIFRLRKPGMPLKHHYPRQPKSPLDGAVKDGKLKIVREANTLVVECAIPWSEMPHVKERIDAGQTIKFSYRVNNNGGGPTMELARQRSVSRRNGSFKVDWVEHWSNELEFGSEGR